MAMLSSSSLIGDEVTDVGGERLGKIEDLVFDVESGEVEYAVLSVGGVMGLGDKYFAVPLQAMSKKPDADVLVLDIDKERLENAPGFDKANWPTRPDPRFCEQVRAYYGARPGTAPSS